MLFLFLACSGAPSDDTATDDTGASLPEPVVLYLSGTSQYSDAGGTPRGEPSAEVLRRTVTPADAALEELVHEGTGRTATDYTLTGVIDPDAGTYTFSFATEDGTISGEGTLDEGEAWAWTAWHSTSAYVDGTYVGWTIASTDRLDGDTFTASKSFTDEAGDPQGSVDETMDVVDEATWQAAMDAR